MSQLRCKVKDLECPTAGSLAHAHKSGGLRRSKVVVMLISDSLIVNNKVLSCMVLAVRAGSQ